MDIYEKKCPDLKTAALGAFQSLEERNQLVLDTLPIEKQLELVQIALYNAFNAEYGILIFEQSDLDQIHKTVLNMQKGMAQSQALSEKWGDKSQIEPPDHLNRFPFPDEMIDAICLYLSEEGFQEISQGLSEDHENILVIQIDEVHYNLEDIMFEALDQQCIVYNIEPEILENMKLAIYERHNKYIDAQNDLDPRLRDFCTDGLIPS